MERFPGYTLVRTEDCPEQHGTLTVLTHDVSGATVLLVENEDTNKAFGIGFGQTNFTDGPVEHLADRGAEHAWEGLNIAFGDVCADDTAVLVCSGTHWPIDLFAGNAMGYRNAVATSIDIWIRGLPVSYTHLTLPTTSRV